MSHPSLDSIREDTLNLDERLIESAITPRTKAIVPVHYAGVACQMDAITTIARRHGLKVVEDATQGVMSSYKGRTLGCIGDFGAYSFHETKNVISGDGGALLVNDPKLALRAEIICEKSTIAAASSGVRWTNIPGRRLAHPSWGTHCSISLGSTGRGGEYYQRPLGELGALPRIA